MYGGQAAWDEPSFHREQTTKSPSASPHVSVLCTCQNQYDVQLASKMGESKNSPHVADISHPKSGPAGMYLE